MLLALLIVAGLVGILLGLSALSFVMPSGVTGLVHEVRPPRERRAHQHPDISKRPVRFPPVPAPLAPSSQTPRVLERVNTTRQPMVASMPVLESVQVAAVTPIVPLASSVALQARPSAPPAVSPVAAPVSAERAAELASSAIAAISQDKTLQQLIEDGHLIQAVKRYRGTHGVGLAEAKQAFEAWRHRSTLNQRVAEVAEHVVEVVADDAHIVGAIKAGKFIEAIKLYRAKTGVSLQDAKAAIDEWRRQLGR